MLETSFRELLARTIELYKERRKVDKELEEKKEAIRQHSEGKYDGKRSDPYAVLSKNNNATILKIIGNSR